MQLIASYSIPVRSVNQECMHGSSRRKRREESQYQSMVKDKVVEA